MERYPHAASSYKSPRDFIEDFLFRTDALGQQSFRQSYSIEIDGPTQQRLFKIIQLLKEQDPFASLTSKFGNLLGLVHQAIQNNNTELAEITLGQLADELEVTEKTLRTQDRRNLISIVVSTVGVILTLVFGALTFMPIILQSTKQQAQQSLGTYPSKTSNGLTGNTQE